MSKSIVADESCSQLTEAEKTDVRPRWTRKPKRQNHLSRLDKIRRAGLPDGFIPRFHRYGRLVLLEENIYRLPDGKEFVPCLPTGTLASGRHLYALLSVSQFERGERGSVFVRLDGRVFDYSNDQNDPDRDLFDTGYELHDLERTGRYACPFSSAPKPGRGKRKEKGKRARAVRA
jgi:hypothetical protein